MKKRKLNSRNPKYIKEEKIKTKRILMKETEKFKMYFVWELKKQ